MTDQHPLAAFAQRLLGHDSYVIAGHVNPDPDCLGTMLALGWGLQQLGKHVTLVSPDPVPQGLRFLPGWDKIVLPPAPKADALLVVDCEVERTGRIAAQRDDFGHIYNLDHHVTNTASGPDAYVDPTAAATGELALAILLDFWGLNIDADTAFNLYAAIMSDTGGFRFNNTTAATLRAAARLVESGVTPAAVAGAVYDNVSWPAFQLLRAALNQLFRSSDGRVAWIVLTKELLSAHGATDGDSAGLSQYPRMISGVDVSMLVREMDDGSTRVSLRSKGDVDVSVIASRFGGGGHAGAAGCTISTRPYDALPKLLEAVDNVLGTTTLSEWQARRLEETDPS